MKPGLETGFVRLRRREAVQADMAAAGQDA